MVVCYVSPTRGGGCCGFVARIPFSGGTVSKLGNSPMRAAANALGQIYGKLGSVFTVEVRVLTQPTETPWDCESQPTEMVQRTGVQ